MNKKIILKKGKEASIVRKHPWVFSGAIQKMDNGSANGEIVQVIDFKNAILGFGHYQMVGSISVRMLQFGEEEFSENLFEEKFQKAFDLRKDLGIINKETNCYRLIHGEGDNLPGLIIDIYDKCAVVQCHSYGMFLSINTIHEALEAVYKGKLKTIFCKSAATLYNDHSKEGDFFLKGDQTSAEVIENGHKFSVNWVEGQKTGFFLDQRDNRALVETLSKGKRVFNAFCYTGGFSVYALAGGARQVISIDSSLRAMDLVDQNILSNKFDGENHISKKSDVMEWLKIQKDESFEMAIVDPPAYAKNHAHKHKASMAYRRLNAEALRTVKKGGFLLTFSCSQAIDNATFRSIVFAAGIDSGRNIQILKNLSQGPDHPVNLYHPEGEYLKGLLLRVE